MWFGKDYVQIGKILYGNFAIVHIQKDKADQVLNELGLSRMFGMPIFLTLLGKSSLEASGISQVQHQPYLDLKGKGVLVAFMGTGIDYRNDCFKYEDGTTKIKYIWDQSIEGTNPEGYYFGTEYTEDQINDALKSKNPHDVVPHQDTVRTWNFFSI
ncbi:MAG: hypothetical protein FWC68_01190 [Oscillospiraceae bacterium]|nr:hypothetical protein [Oscillospiraceae bacterium]